MKNYKKDEDLLLKSEDDGDDEEEDEQTEDSESKNDSEDSDSDSDDENEEEDDDDDQPNNGSVPAHGNLPSLEDMHKKIVQEMYKCGNQRAEADKNVEDKKAELEAKKKQLEKEAALLKEQVDEVHQTGKLTKEAAQAGLDYVEKLKELRQIDFALRLLEGQGKALGGQPHSNVEMEGALARPEDEDPEDADEDTPVPDESDSESEEKPEDGSDEDMEKGVTMAGMDGESDDWWKGDCPNCNKPVLTDGVGSEICKSCNAKIEVTRGDGKLLRFETEDGLKKAHATGYPLEGRMKFRGLDISIENKKGSTRSGVDKEGKAWSVKMSAPYGYIKKTESSADHDHVDCFIGPNKSAENVYIIDALDKTNGKFDEQKCMLGFNSAEEAKRVFLANYDSPRVFGSMKEMPYEEFEKKVLSTLPKGGGLIKATDVAKSIIDLIKSNVKGYTRKNKDGTTTVVKPHTTKVMAKTPIPTVAPSKPVKSKPVAKKTAPVKTLPDKPAVKLEKIMTKTEHKAHILLSLSNAEKAIEKIKKLKPTHGRMKDIETKERFIATCKQALNIDHKTRHQIPVFRRPLPPASENYMTHAYHVKETNEMNERRKVMARADAGEIVLDKHGDMVLGHEYAGSVNTGFRPAIGMVVLPKSKTKVYISGTENAVREAAKFAMTSDKETGRVPSVYKTKNHDEVHFSTTKPAAEKHFNELNAKVKRSNEADKGGDLDDALSYLPKEMHGYYKQVANKK